MVPEIGQTICGRVRLDELVDERVGAAAFGQLIQARLQDTDEHLWLTVIDRKLMPSQKDLSRFMAGANALPALRHPSLVRVGLVDREADFVVVGCEILPGASTLSELIEEERAQPMLARIAAEVARGLAFLHRRDRVHGALTAGTVLLWEGAPVLVQYGLAELCDAKRFAELSSRVGGDVVAPEVRAGDGLDPRVDVFAWGVLMACAIAGEGGAGPVMAAQADELPTTLSKGLRRVIKEALADDPHTRPFDAVELLERLQEVDRVSDDEPDSELGDLARRYLAEVAQSADPLPPPPSAGAAQKALADPDKTPADGVRLDALIGQERELQREREQKQRQWEEKQAKWGKPPAPIPVKLEPSKPPPPPRAQPRLERAPSRPGRGVEHTRSGSAPLPEPPSTPAGGEPDLEALLASESGLGELEDPKRSAKKKAKRPRDNRNDTRASQPGTVTGPPEEHVRLELDAAHLSHRHAAAASGAGASGAMSTHSMSRPAIELTRRPGPHGPRGPALAGVLAVLCTVIALGLTIRVAAAQGGLALLLGLRDSDPPAGEPDETPTDVQLDDDVAGPAASDQVVVAPNGECPEDMVELGKLGGNRVCIDAGEYPGLRQPPATLVSFEGAVAACKERGRRLCSTVEWYRACAGPKRWRFPYGNEHAQDRCNEASASGAAHDLSRSGARDGCRSSHGVFDMVGNAAEWVAEGVAVGGDATTVQPDCKTRIDPGQSAALPTVGFRCCLSLADPPN